MAFPYLNGVEQSIVKTFKGTISIRATVASKLVSASGEWIAKREEFERFYPISTDG